MSELGTSLSTNVDALEVRSRATGNALYDLGLAVLLVGGLVAWFLFDKGGATLSALAFTTFTLAPPLLIALVECFAEPAGPRKSRRTWLLHFQIMVSWYLSYAIMVAGLIAMLTMACTHFGFVLGLLDLRWANTYGLIGLIGVSLFTAIAGDFFFYWLHRMMHQVPFLWQHHKMHHMDEAFDALTGARQNWTEGLFEVIFLVLPYKFLFRTDNVNTVSVGIASGVTMALFYMFKFINHANLRIQFGRASFLLTSSQLHRIHHSRLPQHIDKNYAATFPIWDVIFGTYYAPARDEFPPTGVDGERELGSFWDSQVFAIRAWLKMLNDRKIRVSVGEPADGQP